MEPPTARPCLQHAGRGRPLAPSTVGYAATADGFQLSRSVRARAAATLALAVAVAASGAGETHASSGPGRLRGWRRCAAPRAFGRSIDSPPPVAPRRPP